MVREMPPMLRLASTRIGLMPVRRCNSMAAVSPAGPAPMMIATPCFMWILRFSLRKIMKDPKCYPTLAANRGPQRQVFVDGVEEQKRGEGGAPMTIQRLWKML